MLRGGSDNEDDDEWESGGTTVSNKTGLAIIIPVMMIFILIG